RTASDIVKVRQMISDIEPQKSNIPIIAKLERPEAIENLNDILTVADGVMVARGDLAVETSPASVPVVQKQIIRSANRHAKYVITATQMLESMVNNPRPTRAEASDVANAIFDGTDAVMLSAETAIGKYPVESIQMMHRIIEEAESHFCDWGFCDTEKDQPVQDDAISTTRAARELAHDRNVAAIAVFTQTGRTAVLMSKARPEVPILAFTPEKTTYRVLNMYWGVTPYMVPYANTVEKMILEVENCIATQRKIKRGSKL
ncbi:MAG: pyruvate kinase, partial [Anaerolineales bacterium]